MSRKEGKFRNRIIKTLEDFKDRNIIKDVHDNCGQNEYGIDVVIEVWDVFGNVLYYGFQIKHGDISCSSGKSNKKIQELIGQVMIAHGEGWPHLGNTCQYSGIYIITDGKFNSYAELYIRSACQAVRNLTFVDGKSLDGFFKKFPPNIQAKMNNDKRNENN